MKKLLFSLLAAVVAGQVSAQTAPQKNLGIVNKTTATWCGPCGGWGWTLFENIVTDNDAKAICMGTYGSTTSDMYNQTAGDFYKQFANNAGWPAFCALGYNRTAYSSTGSIYTSATQANIKKAIDSFATLPVTASTGFSYTISGNTLNVNTLTKFWAANSGEFYVNVYLIEEDVMNTQNGQTGVVAHHNVLRGGVDGTWGTAPIANGAITANQTFSKPFTYTIPAGWDKTKLHVVAMLWKKIGTDYRFVNANNVASTGTTGVNTILAAGNVRMYPNPANNNINLSIDVEKAADVSYILSDIAGRTVATEAFKNVGYGNFNYQINTSAIPSGIYTMRLVVGGQTYTDAIRIAH